eukprot:1194895-Prorocentrum_minimum.AAC.1
MSREGGGATKPFAESASGTNRVSQKGIYGEWGPIAARWCSRGGVVCGSRRRNFADCVEMGMPPPWQPAGLQASGARARAWHDCWREPE